jgi:hypothetical protein
MATPGDITDYMTIPTFRFYGNRRKVDTVRHGEIMFAAKGVRDVSIGHTWFDKPLPLALISRIVKFRMKQNLSKKK